MTTQPPWLKQSLQTNQPWAPIDLTQTPLVEVNPESISDLWTRLDQGVPIDQLITQAVRALRAEREKWVTAQEESKARARRRRIARDQKKQLEPAFHARAARLLGLEPPPSNTPSTDSEIEYE